MRKWKKEKVGIWRESGGDIEEQIRDIQEMEENWRNSSSIDKKLENTKSLKTDQTQTPEIQTPSIRARRE